MSYTISMYNFGSVGRIAIIIRKFTLIGMYEENSENKPGKWVKKRQWPFPLRKSGFFGVG